MKRPLLASVVLVALTAAACTDGATGPAASEDVDQGPGPRAERPNVLLIVTDDQRDRTLDVMPKTRRWFARGGTRYTNAFVTTPLCCPSRASIMTGQYGHNHRVLTNHDAHRLPQERTIQHRLREAGYRTAMVGKYYNRWPLDRDPPGFDRWSMFGTGYYDRPFNIEGEMRNVAEYSTDYLARRARAYLRWFEREDDRPWMLYVATSAPHGPFTPPERYRDAAVPPWDPDPSVEEEDVSDKPLPFRARGRAAENAPEVRALQLRTLMAVDDLVGAVMDEIERLGADRDTLAIFVSDNGFLWGEHRLTTKRLPYLPSVQVPLLVRWPGMVEAGARDHRLVANIDLAPTILEAAGVKVGASEMDGRSLLGDHRRDHLLLQYWRDPTRSTVPAWTSVITRTHQYVVYEEETGGEPGFRELYDLERDPWQLENLLAGGGDPAQATVFQELIERAAGCRGVAGDRACP